MVSGRIGFVSDDGEKMKGLLFGLICRKRVRACQGAADVLVLVTNKSFQLGNRQVFEIASRFKREAHLFCRFQKIGNFRIGEQSLTIWQAVSAHCKPIIAQLVNGGLPKGIVCT